MIYGARDGSVEKLAMGRSHVISRSPTADRLRPSRYLAVRRGVNIYAEAGDGTFLSEGILNIA